MDKNTVSLLLGNILLVISIFLIVHIVFFSSLNNLIGDQLQGQNIARPEIVVVSIDDYSLQKIGAWPWDRSIFAQAYQKIINQKPVVIGMDVLLFEKRQGDDSFQKVIDNSEVPIVLGSKIIDNTVLKSLYRNVRSGYVNFNNDQDGKIRRTQVMFRDSSGECNLSFATEIFRSYLRIPESSDLCRTPFKLRNTTYNLDNDNQLIFSYTKSTFQKISFVDVLQGNITPEQFKDKIIIIGSTAVDLRSNLNDNFTGIFGSDLPGIMIHANIINTYLADSFLNSLNLNVVFISLLILTSLLILISSRFERSMFDFVMFAGIFLVINLIGIFIFEFNLQWQFVFTDITLIVCYIYTVLYKYLSQKKQTEFIKKAFEQYMNPKLLSQLLQNPDKLKLGGESKSMTVLFSDIRGFTSISEKMTSQELIQMINQYLDYMSHIIIAHEGTIDKYIGDAIMALWNAPLDDYHHELHAVQAALEMSKSIKKFNEEHPQYPDLKVGVGLNTGDMVVGNVGGQRRFDYTVLGDNVNLGSRLEGLTKKYGVSLIVAESVKKGIEKKRKNKEELGIIFRLLDEVIVKGRNLPVKIYEPLEDSEKNRKIKDEYEEAFEVYQKGKFKEALKLLEESKDDPATKTLKYRVEELIKNPPENWKGIWEWQEK